MHYGKMLEIGPAEEVYNHPLHSYTASLVSAVPEPDPEFERNRRQVPYDASREFDDKERRMVEIAPNHFVKAADDEIEEYRERARAYGVKPV